MASITRIRRNKQYLQTITGPGTLPWQQKDAKPADQDWSNRDARYYLHSSIQGFNRDYLQLTHIESVQNTFNNLCTEAINASHKNIKILKDTAEAVKIPVFKATSTNQPIEDTPVGRVLLGKADYTNEQQQLAATFSDVKRVLDWHTFTDEVIQQLDREYTQNGTVRHTNIKTNQESQAYYLAIGKRISDKLTDMQKLLTQLNTNNEDIQQVLAYITAILDEAGNNKSQYFSDQIQNRNYHNAIYGNGRHQLPKLLGNAYEVGITGTLNSTLDNLFEAIHTGLNGRLSDVIVKQKASFTATTSIPSFGISAKLRRNNSFTFEATLHAQDLIKRLELPIAALNELAFVYNNYIALSIWNTSQIGTRGIGTYTKRKIKHHKYQADTKVTERHRSSQRSRAESLLVSNSTLGQLFKPLIRYINIIMYTTAFFGNHLDLNTTKLPLFSLEYFTQLQSPDRNTPPPVFIQTTDHLYETWKVLQYYIDNNINVFNGGDIINKWMRPEKIYSTKEIHHIYNRKRELLRDAEDDTIYGRLFTNDENGTIMDAMPKLNLFADVFAQQSRKLRTKIKLADQY